MSSVAPGCPKRSSFLSLIWMLGIACSMLANRAEAKLELALPLQSHMVLQRNAKVSIWGWDEPGSVVQVETSWSAEVVRAITNEKGAWSIQLDTPGEGGPYRIEVISDERLVLEDVLIGEVWICGGQSNMEMAVGNIRPGYTGVENYETELANGNHPEIRLLNVENRTSATKQYRGGGTWEVCTPESLRTFSATAYFFGRMLHEELGVPIGLIAPNWGGTVAEAWTSRATLESFGEFETRFKALDEVQSKGGDVDPNSPTALFNGMIHPLVPFGIRGAIWYQGESNIRRAYQYRRLFPAMIQDWRAWFAQGDFPFYYVQIAPFSYGGDQGQAAELREAQLMTLALPHTGMAVTMDIGDAKDIHPRNKQEVGRRLALWALAKTYGQSDLVCSGPLYKGMVIQGRKIGVLFEHIGSGLEVMGETLKEFEIAGPSQEFVPATAEIDGDMVWVTSDQVTSPTAVRYGWRADAEPNLMNAEGLPASSFRTDRWPRLTEVKK